MDFRIYAEFDRWQAGVPPFPVISRFRHLIHGLAAALLYGFAP
jgi:hypothetical protein